MPARKSVERLESLSLNRVETIVREVSLSCVEFFSQTCQERRVSQLGITTAGLDRIILDLQELIFSLSPHYFHPRLARLVVSTLSSLYRQESRGDWECSQDSQRDRRRKLVRKQVLAQFSGLLSHPALTQLTLTASLELGFVRNLCHLLPDFDSLVSLDLGPWPCVKQGLLSGCQGSSLMFLPGLTSLALSDVDTEITQNISVFCPRLTALEIRTSEVRPPDLQTQPDINSQFKVSDEAAYYLSKLRKLERLRLFQVRNISSYGYATLLRNLESLTELAGCDCFPAALSSLVTARRLSQPHLRLETLQCDGAMTEPELEELVAHCPRLRSLKVVYRPHLDSATPHLASLALLPQLANINIVSADFYNHSVFRLLQTCPATLARLELSDCDEMNLTSLVMIGQLCPSLASLTLSCCHFSLDGEQREKINEMCSLQSPPPPVRPFSSLQEATFKMTSPTHLILLKFILHFSDSLLSFSLEDIFQPLEDRFVLTLMSWAPWQHLRSFNLYNSPHLSLMAANAVIEVRNKNNRNKILNISTYIIVAVLSTSQTYRVGQDLGTGGQGRVHSLPERDC